MKKLEIDKLVEISLPHLIKAGRVSENMTEADRQWAYDLIALYQEQMSYGAEIVELSELFFKDEVIRDDEAEAVLADEDVPAVLAAFLQEIEQADELTAEGIKASIKAVQKSTGQKGKKLFMPIRVATTGQTHGPDLPKAIALLGQKKVISRLKQLL